MAWPFAATKPASLSPIWQAAEAELPTGAAGHYGRVMQMPPPPGIPNGSSWTGHLSPQGYDPISPVEWARLHLRAGQFIWDPGSAVNRIFGVRYVISATELKNYGFGTSIYFDLIGERDGFLFYENPGALPRAYLVERFAVEPDMAAARDRIMNGEVDRGDTVLLAEDPGCPVSGKGGSATITHYEPNEVSVEVSANGPGLLVLTDQYDDDWSVEVDGRRMHLLLANTVTRGVCVPSGHHTVRFIYRPWSLVVGGAISASGWLLLAALIAGRLVVNRRRRSQEDCRGQSGAGVCNR
jgi:hypothetical protein